MRHRGALSAILLFAIGCRPSARSDATAPEASAAPPAVSAPSPAVDVVAHASTTVDAGDSVRVASSADGAKLRARNLDRLKNDHSPVTLLKEPPGPQAARELGRRICEAVVPARPPETPVLLKPNIGGFDWFKDPAKNGGDDGLRGRITDPEFVRGVIQCLRARGHQHITVAEGWGATHKDWEKLVRVSGYEQMTNEEHVPLVAMDDDGVFDTVGDQPGKPMGIRGMEATHVPTLLMPKILAEHLEHGLFLSLPKIKAHRFGIVSMAVKGMQGTVMLGDASPAFRQKWRMHRELNPYLDARKKGLPENRAAYVAALETFAERIADVLEIEAPDAVLAEGAPAMGGDGFEKLWPSPASIAIGGTNPVLVDRVGAEWLGLWQNAELGRAIGGHTTSPLIEVAAKRFGIDLASPAVTGDGAALLDTPRPVHFVGMAPFAIHSDDAPPGSAGAAPPVDRKTVHAAPLGHDTIVLDGRGDDAAWKRAPFATWDTDYAGKHTGITTRARFLYSGDALYALFDLEDAGLHVDVSRSKLVPRPKLYDEDCVELFFTPEPTKPNHYYEMEMGPFGHFFDVDVDLDTKKSLTTWSSGAQIHATQNAATHTASIEVKLSAPEITRALAAGRELPLGLFRMEGTGTRSYLAWSPPLTPKPNFHVPRAFGALVLDR